MLILSPNSNKVYNREITLIILPLQCVPFNYYLFHVDSKWFVYHITNSIAFRKETKQKQLIHDDGYYNAAIITPAVFGTGFKPSGSVRPRTLKSSLVCLLVQLLLNSPLQGKVKNTLVSPIPIYIFQPIAFENVGTLYF